MRKTAPAILALLLASTTLPALAQQPPLVPRAVLFGTARGQHVSPKLSPDGTRLAYIEATAKGVPNVFVRALGKADDAQVTFDDRQGVREFDWSRDGARILYLQDSDGDENFHLFSVDLASKLVRDLTPFKGIKAQNLLLSDRRPRQAMVGLNIRDRRVFDMYRVDLETGAVTLDTENPGDVRWWLTDGEFVIRAAVSISAEDSRMELRTRAAASAPWTPIIVWPFGESGVVEGYGSSLAIAFTRDGRGLYVQSALHSDQTRLLLVDAATGREIRTVAEDSRASLWCILSESLYDFAQVLFHPATGDVQAVGFNYLVPEWKVLDPALKPDFEALAALKLGVPLVSSRSADDAKWVVQFVSDVKMPRAYLYDRASRRAEPLFADESADPGFPVAPMEPVSFRARDGMEIPAYLILPPGLPARNLPLVSAVHGGPWTRVDWGLDIMAQWLANRGFAVLQVNFRGSSGYGKRFMNAGNGQWGVGAMQDDLTDAVREMVKRGIADPRRVAIFGASYGGYASLCGLTFTPEVYACGIAMSGFSNLKTGFETFPDFWLPVKRRWIRRVGDPEHDDALNRRISPLFHVDAIRSPLLLVHGANDPRVKISESDQIVKAMRDRAIPVTYVVYPDEGHGVVKPQNMMDLLGRMEEFLGKNLGVRHEPWAKVEGASAELR